MIISSGTDRPEPIALRGRGGEDVPRVTRNRFAGEPFDDSDEVIAAALAEVSVPALLCSLVHMTGDLSWVRGDLQPNVGMSLDIQGAMSEADMAEVRRRALPAIAAYRDGGCVPVELSRDALREMMSFLGRRPVEDRLAGLLFDDLQFEGGDSGEIAWGDAVSESQKAASPVVVIGCGMGGILAGIRLTQAGLPFTIVDKNAGPGGTWWENRYPGARVDVGSHQYCFSFEPAEFWSEYYCQQPELCAYFGAIVDKYDLLPHCRFETAVTDLAWQEDQSMWRVGLRAGGWRNERGGGAFRRQRRGLAQSAPAARHSRAWIPSPDRPSTRRAGPMTWTCTGPGSRSWAPAPAGSRSDPPSQTMSNSSPSSSAPHNGSCRTGSTTPPCRTGMPGRSGTCPSTDGGTASS